jgi:hypothetical protein
LIMMDAFCLSLSAPPTPSAAHCKPDTVGGIAPIALVGFGAKGEHDLLLDLHHPLVKHIG